MTTAFPHYPDLSVFHNYFMFLLNKWIKTVDIPIVCGMPVSAPESWYGITAMPRTIACFYVFNHCEIKQDGILSSWKHIKWLVVILSCFSADGNSYSLYQNISAPVKTLSMIYTIIYNVLIKTPMTIRCLHIVWVIVYDALLFHITCITMRKISFKYTLFYVDAITSSYHNQY